MKLGILKNILQENAINTIVVHIPAYIQPLTVLSAEFDTRTRSAMFLKVSEKKPPRTNNYNMMRSYMLDFKDTHTVYIENLDKSNTTYLAETTFEIDKTSKVLHLHAGNPM